MNYAQTSSLFTIMKLVHAMCTCKYNLQLLFVSIHIQVYSSYSKIELLFKFEILVIDLHPLIYFKLFEIECQTVFSNAIQQQQSHICLLQTASCKALFTETPLQRWSLQRQPSSGLVYSIVQVQWNFCVIFQINRYAIY